MTLLLAELVVEEREAFPVVQGAFQFLSLLNPVLSRGLFLTVQLKEGLVRCQEGDQSLLHCLPGHLRLITGDLGMFTQEDGYHGDR
jgi:hypothetical protein